MLKFNTALKAIDIFIDTKLRYSLLYSIHYGEKKIYV